MSRIDSLRIFTEVVSARNFTTAGKRLGLTPSAVSKQIGLLEERLGVRLLNRTTRSVNPTEAGEIYAERCRRILEELDETEDLIADMDSAPRGTLKIAVETVFGRAILARVLSEFNKAFPGVRAELFLTDHSLELVKQGFDVGVHLGSLSDPALESYTFASHSVVMCATQEYLDTNGTPTAVKDLIDHQLIKISSMEFRETRQLDDYFADLGVTGNFVMTVNDTDMAYHAAMAGTGIAPLPNYLVYPQISRGRLIHVLPDVTTSSQPVQLVVAKHRRTSAKAECFIDFLKSFFN